MAPRQLTCVEVDRDDLEERYLAGRLSEPDAEAFEAHYFACERCWSTVSRGLEVRAAGGAGAAAAGWPLHPSSDATAPSRPRGAASAATTRPPGAPSRTPVRWGALAAAASLLVAVALWRASTGPDAATTTVRGSTDSLHVVAHLGRDSLHAAWPVVRDAVRYRARLLTANAAVLLARETADTAVAVPRSMLDPSAGATLYWDVQALDRLQRVVARSGPVAVTVVGPP